MPLLRFLVRTARSRVLLSAVAAVLTGALNAGLIAIVHAAITARPVGARSLLALFAAFALGRVVAGYGAELLMVRYAQRSVADVRLDLARRLLGLPLRRFEQLGPGRVYAALTDDVAVIATALYLLPGLTVNGSILAGGAVYMIYLSPVAFVALAAPLASFVALHVGVRGRAGRAFERARAAEDRMVSHLVALSRGMKELKLHRPRREAYLRDELAPSLDAVVEHTVDGHRRYLLSQGLGRLFFFAALGIALFALPLLPAVPPYAVSGYVITCLYVLGPLNALLGALPQIARARVAFARVEALGVRLSDEPTDAAPASPLGRGPSGSADGSPAPPRVRERIELRDVVYRYDDADDPSLPAGGTFTLGPVCMGVAPGEVVFVTGPNGSGKSTLGRVLCGLYPPTSGDVLWDGAPVGGDGGPSREAYRQLFSAVFFDFHLFERLLGVPPAEADATATRWLGRLGLAGHVELREGRPSTLALSSGQRRRLALLAAYAEDRPVYLFDEWAADQDPAFKRVFYEELLPELRARGKAVVAITHDAAFADLADRCVTLDASGRLAADQRNGADSDVEVALL
ncbi:MAG: cyclic peptide export ABC transporter [Myxococcales bacterium]|nr:cyclic peptide export ABC transporter [Myxococcales bacterium]